MTIRRSSRGDDLACALRQLAPRGRTDVIFPTAGSVWTGQGHYQMEYFQIKRRAGEGAVVVREDDVRQPPADGRVNVDPSFLALALLLAVAGASAAIAAPTAPAHQCSDPCLQAARDARSECVSSASGAFTDALGGCLARDHECIDACRFQLQECRDSTELGAGLAACQLELRAAKDRCRDRFPLGSRRREICIDRAQVAGSRCRRGVFRNFRQALRDCRSAFGSCADACAPGGPPGGVQTCKADAKAALKADLTSCKVTYQATASGCINKDVTCVQGCADARDTCSAPTQSTLLAASMACTAQEKAAAAACAAANPGGGSTLQQCLMTAQSNAFVCRQIALEAAGPGFAACTQQYVGCVAACPKA